MQEAISNGYRELMIAVMIQTVRDACQQDSPSLRHEAREWLASPDATLYQDAIGLPETGISIPAVLKNYKKLYPGRPKNKFDV